MRRAAIAWVLVLGCDKPAAPPPDEPDAEPTPIVDEEPDPAAFELAENAPTNKSACDERVSFANAAIKRGAEQAALGCRRDEDCIIVSLDTGCQGACQGAIAAEHEDKYTGLQSAIDGKICKDYRTKDKCPYATPRCLQGAAKCNYGTCEFDIGSASY